LLVNKEPANSVSEPNIGGKEMLGPMATKLPPVGESNHETVLLLVAVRVTGVPQVTESP
jgi:hypothetical protein